MGADLEMLATDRDLLPLWRAVHRRLCSGGDAADLSTVKVENLSRAGVSALRSYLDTTTRSRRGKSAVRIESGTALVPIRRLLLILGLTSTQLPELVARAVGEPIVDRGSAARQTAVMRQDLWAYAEQRLHRVPGLVAKMRAAGFSGDEVMARQQIDALAVAISMLPMKQPTALAKLAHDTTGDPHYFDLDLLPGARLVAAVAELLQTSVPERPHLIRALLARAGIIGDRLSATVLLMNVAVIGDGVIDRRLREATGPVSLNLMDLTEAPPKFERQTITVVENPSVLEAAISQGVTLPLVCTSGQLRAVDHVLLTLARDCGAHLRYAGDLDVYGHQIADTVARLYGATVIAMDEETTQEAARRPAALQTRGDKVYQEHDACLWRILRPVDED